MQIKRALASVKSLACLIGAHKVALDFSSSPPQMLFPHFLCFCQRLGIVLLLLSVELFFRDARVFALLGQRVGCIKAEVITDTRETAIISLVVDSNFRLTFVGGLV
jgi:hypothetical protein